MLSRLAPPASGTARLVAVVPVRTASNLPATTQSGAVEPEHKSEHEPNFFQKIVLRFQGVPLPGESQKPKSAFDQMHAFAVPKPLPEMPKDYKEYPERDLANFHYPTKTLYPPKTRLLVFPDSWFTPFQKVTGTSGPYLFYGGLFAFLVNKEIRVFEENAANLLGFIYVYVIPSRVFGYRVDKWSHEFQRQHFANLRKIIRDDLKDAVNFRMKKTGNTRGKGKKGDESGKSSGKPRGKNRNKSPAKPNKTHKNREPSTTPPPAHPAPAPAARSPSPRAIREQPRAYFKKPKPTIQRDDHPSCSTAHEAGRRSPHGRSEGPSTSAVAYASSSSEYSPTPSPTPSSPPPTPSATRRRGRSPAPSRRNSVTRHSSKRRSGSRSRK